MKMKNLILITLLPSLILSCSGKITSTNDLFYLTKGKSYSKLDSLFSLSSDDIPKFEVNFDNQKFKIVVASLENYKKTIINEDRNIKREVVNRYGPDMGSGPTSYTTTYTETKKTTTTTLKDPDDFYLIFQDNKLDNWGYLYEFKNSNSQKMYEFALKIQEAHKNFKKSKGEEDEE